MGGGLVFLFNRPIGWRPLVDEGRDPNDDEIVTARCQARPGLEMGDNKRFLPIGSLDTGY